MFEKPKHNSLENTHKNDDSYSEWSDSYRIAEYAHTGDASCLTPTLARSMKIGYEQMLKVPGVTTEDVEAARIWSEEFDFETEAVNQKILENYGLDKKSIENLTEEGTESYIKHLFETASLSISIDNINEQLQDREIAVKAYDMIIDFLMSEEGCVNNLFSVVRYTSSEGVRDIQIIKKIFQDIHQKFILLSNTSDISEEEKRLGNKYAQILNEYAEITNYFSNIESVPSDINYLTYSYLNNFCLERRFTEPSTIDNEELWLADQMIGLERLADFNRDTLIPFEIERGRIAIFDWNSTALYTHNKKNPDEYLHYIDNLKSQIEYSVKGQYFARRIVADIPPELMDEADYLIDAGEQVGLGSTKDIFVNQEQLRDYLHLLRADMRETIENDFNFSLKDLSIKEQVYFLTYLQKSSVEKAESVSNLVSSYGVSGMRTFLSLEQGDESLGNDIVEFGQNFGDADKIFSYYGELLDSADNAEELVKEAVDCDSVECYAFIEQVRENILNRAQKDLEKAVRAKDLKNLEQSLGNYVAEAKEYVALLQEVGRSNIEKVSANSLSEADKKSMAELLIKNYEAISPGEDQAGFREAVLSSLINSFDNPNTEFRILRDKDKIVSFNRFDTVVDERGNEITYFGSFNADPTYSGVGGVVLEETIKDRLKDGRPMQAHTDPNQPITKKYINSGFVVTNIEQNYANTGRMIFEIWQSPDVNNILKTKQAGDDELLSMIGSEDGEVTVREQRENDKYEEIDSGMVLTRYIKDKNKTYLVFEKYTFGAREDGVDNENKLKEKEAA
ncbi:MAG: hypothetical protein R3B60_01635 [Candidatus Paceibacterota bacterium]